MKWLTVIIALVFSQLSFAELSCSAGTLRPSQDKRSLALGGPRLTRNGAIWTYARFETGKLYRYCLNLPVLEVGRNPSYKKFRDNLHITFTPPPASPGANIYFALIDPSGTKYIEPSEHFSASRSLFVRYKKAGTWILEVMVKDGQTENSINVSEIYGGFRLQNFYSYIALQRGDPASNIY